MSSHRRFDIRFPDNSPQTPTGLLLSAYIRVHEFILISLLRSTKVSLDQLDRQTFDLKRKWYEIATYFIIKGLLLILLPVTVNLGKPLIFPESCVTNEYKNILIKLFPRNKKTNSHRYFRKSDLFLYKQDIVIIARNSDARTGGSRFYRLRQFRCCGNNKTVVTRTGPGV